MRKLMKYYKALFNIDDWKLFLGGTGKLTFGNIISIIIMIILASWPGFMIIFTIDSEQTFNSPLLLLLLAILIVIPIYFISILLLSIPPLISKKINRAAKLSNEDFKKSKEYYRNLLKNYNLVELAYIDNMESDYPKDAVVALLNMQM